MNNLDRLWTDIAGSVKPVAHILKSELKHRWVRFHSLPESKRYPDGDGEMQIIIARHNEVLSTVFMPSEDLVFVALTWPDKSPEHELSMGYSHWRDIVIEEDDPENHYHLYVKSVVWSVGCLDWAISSSAKDELFGFLVVGTGSKVIYHPYDGGMDLILPKEEERDALKAKYANYLSSHPAGL